MRIAVPLEENRGVDSRVAEHFGRARFFLIYDTESGSFEVIDFEKEEKGVCSPASFLIEKGVHAVYVLGMGYKARCRLEEAGVQVLTGGYTVARDVLRNLDRLDKFKGGCAHH